MTHQKGPITSTYTAELFLRGGGKRVIGRMDEDDLGKVTGPKENTSRGFTYLPI
jgi:hypothetical protein